jgi:polyisoprenoid-binding protein YceI
MMTTATQTRGLTGSWTIDPAHSLVEFSGKHMMFTTVKGRFREVGGTLLIDEAGLERSSVEVEIQAASIDSGVEQRDGHLRSADFLDVENNPTIAFRSTGVQPIGTDRARVRGELTIRGTTRPVELDVAYEGLGTNPWGKEVVGFSATTEINRKEYGLTWNVALEAGGLLVGEQVKIHLEVQATRAE